MKINCKYIAVEIGKNTYSFIHSFMNVHIMYVQHPQNKGDIYLDKNTY